MIALARSCAEHLREMAPLTWMVLWSGYPQNPGQQWLVFICCGLGHVSFLRHEIDVLGRCTPSLVCACPSCDWHVYATLAGWSVPSRYAALLARGVDETTARATCAALGEGGGT